VVGSERPVDVLERRARGFGHVPESVGALARLLNVAYALVGEVRKDNVRCHGGPSTAAPQPRYAAMTLTHFALARQALPRGNDARRDAHAPSAAIPSGPSPGRPCLPDTMRATQP